MQIRFLVGLALLAVVLATYPAWRWFRGSREPAIPPAAASNSTDEIPSESRPPAMFMSVSMDMEGISNPPLFTAEEVELADNEAVIGVASGGEARAYLRSAFAGRGDRHIVNDVLAGRKVAVTHCDMTFCTRVFTNKGESPLNIHCGGWTVEHGLTLLVDGVEHTHQSKKIPLQDVPFVVTTWKRWLAAHPGTKVYLGPFAVPKEPSAG